MYSRTEQGATRTIEGYIDRDVTTVPGEATISQALDAMISNDASVVMVVDGEDVVGLMTSADMGTMVARGIDLDAGRARDFTELCGMSGSRPCTRVNYDEDPINVLKVMQHWGTDRILVVKNEKVVGTVSALGALKSWRKRV
jgi:CBS domain-containing protein